MWRPFGEIAGGPVFIGKHVEVIPHSRQQLPNSMSCLNVLLFDFIHFSSIGVCRGLAHGAYENQRPL
jgi:hypothetical protein